MKKLVLPVLISLVSSSFVLSTKSLTKKIHAEILDQSAGLTFGNNPTTYHMPAGFNTNNALRQSIITLLVENYNQQYLVLSGQQSVPTTPYVWVINSHDAVTYIYINDLVDAASTPAAKTKIINDARQLQEEACNLWRSSGWTKFPVAAYSGTAAQNYVEKWTWNFH
jgi:hypothetical protein